MNQTNLLMERIINIESIKHNSFNVDPAPLDYFSPEDSIEFHSSRILLLIYFCSSDKIKTDRIGIKGRTKLAKLDFFLRYPLYLDKILDILDKNKEKLIFEITEIEKHSIEAKMIRYKYGPWDEKYYDVFAYLTSKGLIDVITIGGVDFFSLSETGQLASNELVEKDVFQGLISRCHVIKKVLGRRSGTSLKNIIYEYFPEIVRTPVGSPITGTYYE